MSSKWYKFRNKSIEPISYKTIKKVEKSEIFPTIETVKKVYETTVTYPKEETIVTKTYTYPKKEKIYQEYQKKEKSPKLFLFPRYSKKTIQTEKIDDEPIVENYYETKINPGISILPNVKEFLITFKNNELNENDFDENENKIKIDKDVIFKIFEMAKIPKNIMSAYIYFTFTKHRKEYDYHKTQEKIDKKEYQKIYKKEYQQEYQRENKKENKIDYDNLLKIINNYYVSFSNDDEEKEDIELNKKSLNKIFDLINLPKNERINFLEFYEVEEDEEDDNEEIKNKKNNEPFNNSKPKPIKIMQNKQVTTTTTTKTEENNEINENPKKLKTKNKIPIEEDEYDKSEEIKKRDLAKLRNIINKISTQWGPKNSQKQPKPEEEKKELIKNAKKSNLIQKKPLQKEEEPEEEQEKEEEPEKEPEKPKHLSIKIKYRKNVTKKEFHSESDQEPEDETKFKSPKRSNIKNESPITMKIRTYKKRTIENEDLQPEINTKIRTYKQKINKNKAKKIISNDEEEESEEEEPKINKRIIKSTRKNIDEDSEPENIHRYKRNIMNELNIKNVKNVKNVRNVRNIRSERKVNRKKNINNNEVNIKNVRNIRNYKKIHNIENEEDEEEEEKIRKKSKKKLKKKYNKRHPPNFMEQIDRFSIKGIKKPPIIVEKIVYKDLEENYNYIEKPKIKETIKKNCLYPFITKKLPEYEGQKLYLCGSLPQLGGWNIRLAISMDEELRNGQIFYSKYINIKKDQFPFEYKYFYIKYDKPTWVGLPGMSYVSQPQFFKMFHTMKKNIISIYDLNIRYINDLDGLNIWEKRKAQLIQSILNLSPDILFFQEITKIQAQYIDENLCSVYEFVGVYRDSTDKSEKCSICYNKLKYTLNEWGQFWLSSTPYNPGSNDFKNIFPRICTWASLKQLNGVDLLFFNTHLDHFNFNAHMPSMNVILEQSEKIIAKFPQTKCVFLGGCFYCEEDDPLIFKIKAYGYQEAMFENTFHDFTGEADRHWDYLFWKELNVFGGKKNIYLQKSIVPKRDAVVNEVFKQYISDHYPYYVEFIQKV